MGFPRPWNRTEVQIPLEQQPPCPAEDEKRFFADLRGVFARAARGRFWPRRRPNAADFALVREGGRAGLAASRSAVAPFVRQRLVNSQRDIGTQAVEALDGPRHASPPHPPSGRRDRMDRGRPRRRRDTLRAPVTCCPGAGERPAHGARSKHRKPARGDPPFRRGSDARGAGATAPRPACRRRPARKHPARATAWASTTLPHLEQRPRKSAMNLKKNRPVLKPDGSHHQADSTTAPRSRQASPRLASA